jgi:hypothetical protein
MSSRGLQTLADVDRMILVAGRAAASFVAVMFAVVLVAMVRAWPRAEPAPIAADIPSRAPAPQW